jgi:hypothetical protein
MDVLGFAMIVRIVVVLFVLIAHQEILVICVMVIALLVGLE